MKNKESIHVLNPDKRVKCIRKLQATTVDDTVDMTTVNQIALNSQKRIIRRREKHLLKALKNNDHLYIGMELSNISSYQIIKTILRRMLCRLILRQKKI